MSDSLRDQLLKAGFAPPRKGPARAAENRDKRDKRAGRPYGEARQPQRTQELDLAQAYAIRARAEKAEREAAQREAQKQAQERRERKRRLHELLSGNALSIPDDADHVRHFEHAGKIRRIHVDAGQLSALNRGELGVVVQAGRFVLVARETALRAKEIAEDSVALLVDPEAGSDASGDDVPDDLTW